jgi:hypothetical protein
VLSATAGAGRPRYRRGYGLLGDAHDPLLTGAESPTSAGHLGTTNRGNPFRWTVKDASGTETEVDRPTN